MAALLVLVAVSGVAVGIVIGLQMRAGAHRRRGHSRALVLRTAPERGRGRHLRRAAA